MQDEQSHLGCLCLLLGSRYECTRQQVLGLKEKLDTQSSSPSACSCSLPQDPPSPPAHLLVGDSIIVVILITSVSLAI